jgi:hypothetical protein
VAELEEANVATALRLELDEKTEHSERLRCCNVYLLNEYNKAWSRAATLELKLPRWKQMLQQALYCAKIAMDLVIFTIKTSNQGTQV